MAAAAAPQLDRRVLFAQARSTPQLYGKEGLIVRSIRPPDFETPTALLRTFITPNNAFYVRSHMPIPQVDAATFVLKVGGEVNAPFSLSVDEIKKLPAVTTTVTLECAGNGRGFFQPAVAGIQWEKGAVSTARFTGARMSDVLKKAGVKTAGINVEMHPADRPPGTMPAFVRQVPMAKAMHPDTIIAYDMNGEPIPLVHGAPLRAIIPGWEGAYSVKWLNALNVLAKDSDSFWVVTGYRYPTRRVAPGAAVDAKDMAPLTGLVVKSLITTPANGATQAVGKVMVGGFAWAGEDDIKAVDVSIDNGATWRPARLTGEQVRYAWRAFAFEFNAPRPESYLILSRATDAKGNVQPAVSQWNPSGYLWNQYDSIRIEVK
jgi:sulfite oxidase